MIRTCIAWALFAAVAVGEAEPRLTPNDDRVADLGQDERWAFGEAQTLLAKRQWKPAALAFRKYCDQYQDSALWTLAAYDEAWCIRCDERIGAAIQRIDEVLPLAKASPELPEILLLQGECWQDSGELAKAAKVLQALIDQHPAASAIIPARVRLDDCVANLATQQGLDAAKATARRLAVLAPLADVARVEDRDGWWYARGVERLRDLAFAAGQPERAVALARALAKRANCRDFEAAGFRDDLWRRVYRATVAAGDEQLATTLAGEAWPDATTRALNAGAIRCDLAQAVLDDPAQRAAAAKAQGVKPDDVLAATRAALAARAKDATAAAQSVTDGRRGELAWLAVRAAFLAGDASLALESLVAAYGRGANAGDVRRFVEEGFARRLPATALRAIVDRVEDERERTQALLAACEVEAYRNPAANERGPAAQQAIGLAAKLETDQPERQAEWLRLQARLTEEVLGDAKTAITLYTKLNQPPGTDFDIARCHERLGDSKAAFLKYGEIYATCQQDGNGAEALWRQGVLANEKLGDRKQAILLLRQLCDEFPNTTQYQNAHDYLQTRLDQLYTGGGGKRTRE